MIGAIRVISKETHEVLEHTSKDVLTLVKASVVVVNTDLSNVEAVKQDGLNLLIILKSGEKIIIIRLPS